MNLRPIFAAAVLSCLFATSALRAEASRELTAQLGNPSSGFAKIFIYSEEDLIRAELRFKSVKEFGEMDRSTTFPTHFSFGTNSHYPISNNEEYIVRGWRADGSRITSKLKVVADQKSGTVDLKVEKLLEETKESIAEEVANAKKVAEEAKRAPAAVMGNDNETFRLVNEYRVRNNLPPFIWDSTLAIADDANHSRFRRREINASLTCWAGSTGAGALSLWQNSPTHHSYMLTPGVHYAGVGILGNTATLNIR